jgi:hypothetical protein
VPTLTPLPSGYVTTRDGLHRVAAHVVARARHVATGRFGLYWTAGGFGTPVFGNGQQVRVAEDRIVVHNGDHVVEAPIESLAQAAAVAGVDLSSEFSVGHETPPLGDPAAPLGVDREAGAALGDWFGFGASLLEDLCAGITADGGDVSRVQLWPEHFDIAFDGAHEGAVRANVGCSPGDTFHPGPYVYVGPWEPQQGDYWNAPFGAYLSYAELLAARDPATRARGFVDEGLSRLRP